MREPQGEGAEPARAGDARAGDAVQTGGAARAGGAAEGGNAAQVPSADPEAVSRFVEAFASQLVEAGLGRMPARVFAALLASEEGVLTSAELGERLRVSPAAVSGAVRYLSQVAMVSREREPGSRRERYRVHSNQWYEMLTDRETMLRRWEHTMREGVATMGPDSRPGQRIAETLEFFSYMKSELEAMMERWRKHREELFGASAKKSAGSGGSGRSAKPRP